MKDESLEVESKPHRVEFDAKELEYYSYLRTIVEANEISYWIGNPSVSIINGAIGLAPLTTPSHPYDAYQDYLEHTRRLNILETPQDNSPIKPEHPSESREDLRLRSQCLALCGIPNSKSPVEILENSLFGQYMSAII
jgi:hypothetical protein